MKFKGLRWWIITLIAIATVINYIDRNALAVMWPGISKDLQLDKEQYAFVVSCFLILYGVSQSLSGRLFDKIGTRIGMVMSIGLWSVAAALHSFSQGILSFSVFRGLLGLGEAGNWPGATKSNAEWFPVKERAFAQGIFNSGAAMGAVVSAPLVAYFYNEIGWRTTFLVLGAMGIVWILPWLIINKALPAQHPWLTETERQFILDGQEAKVVETTEKSLSWKQLLSFKKTWAIILSRFLLDPIWWLFVSWLPLYLSEKFHFDIKQIGAFAWFPYVGATIGSLGGGWLTGHWIRSGMQVNKARLQAITLGGAIMLPALIVSSMAETPTMAMGTIFFALMGFQVAINNLQTLPSDYFSGPSVGTLAGMGGTAAIFGVLITTWMVPYLTQISYTPFFVLASILVPLGVGTVWLLGRAKPTI
jgi:ACS family hexuronate transporter-like MFS transporter